MERPIDSSRPKGKPFLSAREIAIFAMLAALMFASKKIMEALPNIHLLGLFIVAMTVVYRWKALFPLYLYVFLDGLFGGFSIWWLPYLYIWTLLWGAVMLLPKHLPKRWAPVIYMAVSGLHGLLFGVLYAPAQALFFHLNFQETVAWVAVGFPFDCIHGLSNLISGLLIVPLIALIRRCDKKTS